MNLSEQITLKCSSSLLKMQYGTFSFQRLRDWQDGLCVMHFGYGDARANVARAAPCPFATMNATLMAVPHPHATPFHLSLQFCFAHDLLQNPSPISLQKYRFHLP